MLRAIGMVTRGLAAEHVFQCIAVFATLVAPTAASAAEPLQPTSKWNLDYGEAQCTAARNYGTTDKPLFLILKPSPEGSVMRVLVARKGGFSGLASETPASLQFDDEPRIKMSGLKFSSLDRKKTIYSVNLSAEEFKARESSKSLTFTAEGTNRTFALEAIPSLLAELEKCRLDLLGRYNADGTRLRQEAMPLKPLSQIFSPRDYPTAAIFGRDQGTVAISMLINEAGKVVDCSVNYSAGVATLDTMSCWVIQERASFHPAIGLDGKPARSVYTQRITWRLE